MNTLKVQGDEIKTNGSLSTKCRHCGLPQPKSSKKSTTVVNSNNEFGTIQLGDIFTDFVPQKSPFGNNNEDRKGRFEFGDDGESGEDDLCPGCSLPPSSPSPHSILMNGMVKVPELHGPPPGGTSVITTQLTPRSIHHYHPPPPTTTINSTNGLSPLPVSVVLPNGYGTRSPHIPATSNNNNNHVNGGRSLSNVNVNVNVIVNGHAQGHHLNNGLAPLTCTLCNKNFKNERLAISHEEKVHSNLARYTCPTCHGKFCYRGALNSHISSHHPQLASYDCSACGKTFKEKSNLSAHHTIVHAQNPRLFKCEFCLSSFSKKVNLNYHRKRKHPGEGPPPPPPPPPPPMSNNTSNKNTSQSSTMENTQYHPHSHHQAQLLGNNKNGSPHAYIPQHHLDQHPLFKIEPMDPGAETEGGGSSSVAAIIDTIASASSSTIHHQEEAGNQSGTSSGKTGSGTSSRAEGDFQFECQYCGRGFLFRNNLKCHLRTHIRDKKYTCEICEKSFIYKESLKNHMLLHSNELPYQCDICMKKFRDRSNRRKHVKNVHKFLLAGNNGGGLPGNNGQGTTASPSTSTSSDPSSQQPKRRKRPPAKKKPTTTITAPISSSPPPQGKGVIVSPKSSEYAQSTRNIVKSEVMSPEGQSQRSPEEYQGQGQGVHFKQEPEGHYLPPSMNHPNVIVYPKPKLEPQVQYHSSSPPDPQILSHPHSVISSSHSHHHQYYTDNYGQGGSGQQEGLPSYVSLMAPPEPMSPERRTGGYESLVHGQRLLRTDSSSPVTQHLQHHHPHHQSLPIQEYSRSQQGSLMYSSPIMGGEVGEGYQHHSYWNPNEPGLPRPYYSDPTGGIPTVTEGSLLNPQSLYVNTSPPQPPPTSDPSTNQIPPNHSHNYFYTDLAQFDLSHL